MKNVMAWIKGHLLVVIFSAIIVISLPASFVGASMWGKSVREEMAKKGSDALTKVESEKVTYSLASPIPGVPAIEERGAANDRRTQWFAEQRERLKALSDSVVTQSTDFNRGVGDLAKAAGRSPHAVLVEGLFPAPKDENEGLLKRIKFAEQVVDRRTSPSVYRGLLASLRAGGPRDPQVLGEQLKTLRDREIEKLTGGGQSQRVLQPEEQAAITQKLVEARRDSYLRRAQEISIYATFDAFPVEGGGPRSPAPTMAGGSRIPGSLPPEPAPVSQCFLWQMDYWLISDLIAAIRAANSSGGTLTDVDRSLVKRLESITLGPPIVGGSGGVASAGGSSEGGEGAAAATSVEQLTGLVPTDLSWSVTGRKSSPQNPLYDVRRAELSLVVSGSRLKELFDAFAKTNFMTVIDLDLSEVDVWGDLEQGYYYGDESVVRARVVVETIWLRSWTEPLFPAGIRAALGLPLPEGMKPEVWAGAPGAASGGPDFGAPQPVVEEELTTKGRGR